MRGSYLGPEFGDNYILRVARRYHAPYQHYPDFDDLIREVAQLLAQGQVVGWFQGRMEWGPRALGNRSILGDPRHPEMQKRLNLKIKYREGFRPFAPSVLYEEAATYFDLDRPSPYMLLVAPVKEERRNPLPPGYDHLELFDRLYHLRSDVPAITHVDYSARIQTVHKETNEKYWRLIQAFKEQTGCGLIVNTSFNVRGEPIVCTPEDAYQCFMRTEMDHLVMGDYRFDKQDQPAWREDKDWRTEFELD
jgi:carbamoyltransferase